MTDAAHAAPPPPTHVRDLGDLQHWWEWLAGPWGYTVPQVFAVMIEADGALVPHVVNVRDDDTTTPPAPDLARGLVDVLASTLVDREGTGVAVMWARPGRSTLTASDREWLAALHHACDAAPFRTWPLFFSTDQGTGPAPADALVG